MEILKSRSASTLFFLGASGTGVRCIRRGGMIRGSEREEDEPANERTRREIIMKLKIDTVLYTSAPQTRERDYQTR
jgi:hypothetical protein